MFCGFFFSFCVLQLVCLDQNYRSLFFRLKNIYVYVILATVLLFQALSHWTKAVQRRDLFLCVYFYRKVKVFS